MLTQTMGSKVHSDALHAVPGTLVNGTLVQPNFVAQVMPSGPYHKQMPAPPQTILSACRTSYSPIGALTKPLHKEEVIASFLPTGM
ncbi:hypothetical protein Ctob_010134 [Chrysochromulina tobinii]|uniref:Uncharacterized protein n=1 Tax=Chrysochromulina tobinii TaxID=1460289 RepID=A0A0M0JL58_9EUKA|nr:hypothetical protein Ctob_010134 [Chrysochromulina tobinii]|eukprot:KOO27319.1 hypothetical protein Ctob_010134 [Chrysochromulina sp. CCMP291]